jgi:membrane protease YdiL (CAAX protease family)
MKQAHTIQRSLPRDTWGWIWPDVLIRLAPFWVISLIAAHFMGGTAAIGLRAPIGGWFPALLAGIALGLALMACAVYWRSRIAPRYRLPTHADQALQTFFYLIMNAPTEELFWRGVVQTLAIRALLGVGVPHTFGVILGVAAISALFGAYHRLGGYPWRFNIAAMLAGAVFGTLYVVLPGPSIVVPTIVHGLMTAGYLSWGDAVLHWRSSRHQMV